MKKLYIVFVLAAMLMVVGCSSKTNKDNDVTKTTSEDKSIEQFIVEQSISLTQKMDKIAEDQELVKLFSATETLLDTAQEIGAQDYSTPQKQYIITYNMDEIMNMLTSESGLSDTLTNEQKELMKSKIGGETFSNLINARSGSEFLAVTSVLSLEEGFIQPSNWQSDSLVYLMYDGGYASITAFREIGDGVIKAVSNFVTSSDDIIDMLEGYGMQVKEWR